MRFNNLVLLGLSVVFGLAMTIANADASQLTWMM